MPTAFSIEAALLLSSTKNVGDLIYMFHHGFNTITNDTSESLMIL